MGEYIYRAASLAITVTGAAWGQLTEAVARDPLVYIGIVAFAVAVVALVFAGSRQE